MAEGLEVLLCATLPCEVITCPTPHGPGAGRFRAGGGGLEVLARATRTPPRICPMAPEPDFAAREDFLNEQPDEHH